SWEFKKLFCSISFERKPFLNPHLERVVPALAERHRVLRDPLKLRKRPQELLALDGSPIYARARQQSGEGIGYSLLKESCPLSEICRADLVDSLPNREVADLAANVRHFNYEVGTELALEPEIVLVDIWQLFGRIIEAQPLPNLSQQTGA